MMRRTSGLLALAVVVSLATPARADKIDGTWCRDDGAHLSIDGPAMVTPGGTSITGDYRRHFFRFVVPQSEPGAGSTVELALLNENTVQERVGTETPVLWSRCSPPVSLLYRQNDGRG